MVLQCARAGYRHETKERAMFRRVVVPLDGSALADAILPQVSQPAADTPLDVLLLTVVTPASALEVATRLHGTIEKYGYAVPRLDGLAAEQEAQLVAGDVSRAHALLQECVRALSADGIRGRTQVRVGEAASEIVRCAESERADVIAMSTHGRRGLDHLLHGSVAEAVLRMAGRPVLLFRPLPVAFAQQRAASATVGNAPE
jgi:nucleotide-binding universal stress UspA family protein